MPAGPRAAIGERTGFRILSRLLPLGGEIALLSAMLAVSLLPAPPRVLVPTLVTIVLIGGIHWGRRVGFAFAVVAVALEYYAIGPAAMVSGYVGYVLVLFPVSAGLIGGYTGRSLKRSQYAAMEAARHTRVLAAALMELPTLDGRRAILHRLPGLLSDILGVSHADVLVPEPGGDGLVVETTFGWVPPPGVRIPISSVTGRAYMTNQPQHVPDTEEDPDFVSGYDMGTGRMRSELALPIEADGCVVAVLNLERREAGGFSQFDVDTLVGVTRAVGGAIERAERLARAHAQNRSQEFLLDLSRTLSTTDNMQEMGPKALAITLERLGADAGCIWMHGTHPLRAGHGPARDAVPWDVIDEYCRTHLAAGERDTPAFYAAGDAGARVLPFPPPQCLRAFAILPLPGSDGRIRAALGLFDLGGASRLDVSARGLLLRTADRLGLALQRAQVQSQLADLLQAIRGLLSLQGIDEVYQRAADVAEALVPGTDAAALFIPQDQAMRVIGSPHYDPARHPHVGESTLEDCLRWYGGSEEEFYAGRPRLQSLDQLPEIARMHGIRANLLLPIVSRGGFLAMLHLHSLTRADAFHSDSVSLAETLSLQLGAIIQQARYREQLEVAAATDSLTGIGNRRAFDARIQAEWSDAQRYGHALSLIVVDLEGFKAVNDHHGHQTGDAALVSITREMNSVRRDGDALFRWGGDEFAIILRHADLSAAIAAAHRYLNALRAAETTSPGGQTVRVAANMGVASAPGDADTIEQLISMADKRVFRAKAHYRPVEPETSI